MTQPQIEMRFLTQADLPLALAIEEACYAWDAWTVRDFEKVLGRRHFIVLAAWVRPRLAGFMAYELVPGGIEIVNLAVAPDHQRQGVGSALVSAAKRKLNTQRRVAISALTRETNLAAHLFLKAQGFRAIEVRRSAYESTDEAGYLFRFCKERP